MLWKLRRELLFLLLLIISSLCYNHFSFGKREFSEKENFPSPDQRILDEKLLNPDNFYAEIISENRRLREILHLKKKIPFEFSEVAEVISRDPIGWSTILILKKGRRNGVKKDMFVMDRNGLLLGKIEEVKEEKSRMSTLLNKKTKVSVIIQRTREEAIVEGKNSALLTLKYLPLTSKADCGDTVITSGLSLFYPKGILVGRIKRIKRERSQLLLSASLQPAVNFSSLEEVIICGD